MAGPFISLGALLAALGVAMGAFGAHALKTKIGVDMLAAFQTGVQYHMVHALGLVLLGLASRWIGPSALVTWSGALMGIGVILFSGSLYLLSITGVKAWGAVTPFGGTAFIVSWVLFAIAAWHTAPGSSH
ncbi:MAG: DUF423 domain-containing protein [Pseudomonadota bacterium]|nr:DUF423 domain-containing protein [Pseudomonadota bacterium]